jgi:hypothetical protein
MNPILMQRAKRLEASSFRGVAPSFASAAHRQALRRRLGLSITRAEHEQRLQVKLAALLQRS